MALLGLEGLHGTVALRVSPALQRAPSPLQNPRSAAHRNPTQSSIARGAAGTGHALLNAPLTASPQQQRNAAVKGGASMGIA